VIKKIEPKLGIGLVTYLVMVNL